VSLGGSVRRHIGAIGTAIKHLLAPRMTVKYPDVHHVPIQTNYAFDPKRGAALPGWRGRHLLYLDKCTGCNLCYVACENIAEAIVMVTLPEEKRPQNKKSLYPAVDYGRCIPPWTNIVTSDGIVPIRDVKVGDKVLTHTGRFRTVTKVFRRRYTGRLYTFRTLGNIERLSVTEEHPLLIYSRGRTEWAFPQQIGYGSYLVRPVIAEYADPEEITFTYEMYHPSGRGGYFTLNHDSVKCTAELMRLIGYYIAEGHADRYRVSFDIDKKEVSIARDIVAAAKTVFGEDACLRPDGRSEGLKLVIDSVKVASFFSQFGTRSDEKHLPPWALRLPQHLAGELVRAIFAGDGHYSNKYYDYMHSNYFTIRTTSRLLANQLLYVLAGLGIGASACSQDQKHRKTCYSVTVHTPYIDKMAQVCGIEARNNPPYSHSYIKLIDGLILSPVIELDVQNVEDLEVMNLEVEGDNSYVASNQIVHNCVFCGFCVDFCPFYALEMTPDVELSEYRRENLFYTPHELAIPPRRPARPLVNPRFEGERVKHMAGG